MKAQREIEKEEEQGEQEKQNEKTTDRNKFSKWIIDEEKDLNEKLFKNHFKFQKPSDMLMLLNRTNDRRKTLN